MGGRVFRKDCKRHMDTTKVGGWEQGREVGLAGVGEVMGGKCRQLYLNNNNIIL